MASSWSSDERTFAHCTQSAGEVAKLAAAGCAWLVFCTRPVCHRHERNCMHATVSLDTCTQSLGLSNTAEWPTVVQDIDADRRWNQRCPQARATAAESKPVSHARCHTDGPHPSLPRVSVLCHARQAAGVKLEVEGSGARQKSCSEVFETSTMASRSSLPITVRCKANFVIFVRMQRESILRFYSHELSPYRQAGGGLFDRRD